jgi:hypothetical protein
MHGLHEGGIENSNAYRVKLHVGLRRKDRRALVSALAVNFQLFQSQLFGTMVHRRERMMDLFKGKAAHVDAERISLVGATAPPAGN